MKGFVSACTRFVRRVRDLVIEGDLPEKPRLLKNTASVFRTLALAGVRFERDLGRERASSLAYSTLLALVPIFLLGVTALTYFSDQDPAQATGRLLDLVIPPDSTTLKEGLREFFGAAHDGLGTDDGEGTSRGGRLSILAVILLIYFAASLMTGVDRMVAAVWGRGSFGDMVRRLSAYWAVITLGPLLLALSFAGTATATRLLPDGAGSFVTGLFPFVVTWLSVFLFYQLMPHTRVRPSAALAGAVVAGSLWEVSKQVMGWYLEQPKTLLVTAGTIPLALLWMYVSWLIAIYGHCPATPEAGERPARDSNGRCHPASTRVPRSCCRPHLHRRNRRRG